MTRQDRRNVKYFFLEQFFHLIMDVEVASDLCKRGWATPIHLMLAYTQGKNSDHGNESISLDSVHLDIPNWIESVLKFTETLNILKLIARVSSDKDLLGDGRKGNISEEILWNLWLSVSKMCIEKLEHGNNLNFAFEEVKENLKKLSDFLSSNSFLIADNITYIDFIMFEVLQCLDKVCPGALNEFPNLSQFSVRFHSIPVINGFFKSNRHRPSSEEACHIYRFKSKL